MIPLLSGAPFAVISILAVACIALLIINARKEIAGKKKAAEAVRAVENAAHEAVASDAAVSGDDEIPLPVLAAAAYYISTEKQQY